jgi:hypothetical protein
MFENYDHPSPGPGEAEYSHTGTELAITAIKGNSGLKGNTSSGIKVPFPANDNRK